MADAVTLVKQGVQNQQGGANVAPSFHKKKSPEIAATLGAYTAQIAQALPKTADLSAERIIQIATTLIGRDSKLQDCSASSVIASVMQAAILGLNPLPQLAECYLIPYKGECQFQIGYRGLITLFHRGRVVRDVHARVVCEGDEFDYEYGLTPILRHKPLTPPEPNGVNVTHAYAVATYLNGGQSFVVLSKQEINRLRDRNPGKSPAWGSDYPAMAQAKALKQLKRFMPSDGASVDTALASDERTFKLEQFRPDGSGVDLADVDFADAVIVEETGEATANAIEQGSATKQMDIDYITGGE